MPTLRLMTSWTRESSKVFLANIGEKISNKFRELGHEYENNINGCSRSGQHGWFNEPMVGYSNTSPAMAYMHEYVRVNKELLNTFITTLPSDVFFLNQPRVCLHQDIKVEVRGAPSMVGEEAGLNHQLLGVL